MSYYQIACYFLLFSFLGWVAEVTFHGAALGLIVNRGFLNGPVCPVYGFGVLAVLAALDTAQKSGLEVRGTQGDWHSDVLLFLFGFVLATLVELAAGWLLNVFFHMRWWDYSDKPFNFHGYICLEFSIIWGLGIAMVIRIIMPVLEKGEHLSDPGRYGWVLVAVLYAVYLFDLVVTVATIIGLNRKLEELDRVRKSLRIVSDKMSEKIGETSLKTSQDIGRGRVQAALAKAEFKQAAAQTQAELKQAAAQTQAEFKQAAAQTQAALRSAAAEKAELLAREKKLAADLAGHVVFGTGRLLRAFPRMTSQKYKETLEALKQRLPFAKTPKVD